MHNCFRDDRFLSKRIISRHLSHNYLLFQIEFRRKILNKFSYNIFIAIFMNNNYDISLMIFEIKYMSMF